MCNLGARLYSTMILCLSVGCNSGPVSPAQHAELILESHKVTAEICKELTNANDTESAKEASRRIRELIPTFVDGLRSMQNYALAASSEDLSRVQKIVDEKYPKSTPNILIAIEDASKGPAADQLRPIMREICDAALDVIVVKPERKRIQATIQKLGL